MPIYHHHHDYSSTSSPPIPKQNSISITIIISLIIKPIIMLFILSIFLFIGIAAVSTIFFLLAGSSLHLCRRRRRPTARITAHELQKHLPRFKYQGRAGECAVCLESIERGEWCRRLTGCAHVFHVKCVDSWLVRVLNCPVCRSPLCFNNSSSTPIIHHHHQSNVDDEFSHWWAVAV